MALPSSLKSVGPFCAGADVSPKPLRRFCSAAAFSASSSIPGSSVDGPGLDSTSPHERRSTPLPPLGGVALSGEVHPSIDSSLIRLCSFSRSRRRFRRMFWATWQVGMCRSTGPGHLIGDSHPHRQNACHHADSAIWCSG
jgi:hypothetical protein